jgi:hypothetical protein
LKLLSTQGRGYLNLPPRKENIRMGKGSIFLLVSAERWGGGMSQEVSAKTEFTSGLLCIQCIESGIQCFFDPWIRGKFLPDLGPNPYYLELGKKSFGALKFFVSWLKSFSVQVKKIP